MTIRVLHLIHDLGAGGAEKQLAQLVERLPAHGVACEVATILDRGALRERVRAAGVPLHTLGARSLADFPSAAWRLASLLRGRRPHILQTWLFYSDLLGRLVARPAGVPVLLCSSRNTDDWRSGAHVLADRFTARLADAVLCNTLAGAARLLAVERLPAARLRVIHNGIDAAACVRAAGEGDPRAEFGIPRDAPLLVAAGRLHAQKDFATLLAAFALLARRIPAARLAIAGEGPERAALEALAAALGVAPAVTFCGALPNVAPLLLAADAVALSSRYEGMPNVLLEAGALGRPVASTAVGGVPELVRDGADGLLVPPGDPAALSAALARLLEERPAADSFAASLAARVRERFPLSRVAARHAELYREFAARAGVAEAVARGTARPAAASPPARRGAPLRVLLAVTRTDVGGAQKHVHDLACGLSRRGVEVTVAGGRGGDLLDRIAAAGIATERVASLDRDIAPGPDLAALLDLHRLIRALRPDLVHAHSSKAGLLARLAARAQGIPCVYTAHGFAFHDGMPRARRLLYRGIERLGGALGDGIIAVSGRDLSVAESEGIGAGALRRAIPNGIDPDGLPRRLAPREEMRAELGVAPGETLVGALGRHCDEKAYDTLLRAVALLPRDGGGARFAILGDGVAAFRARAVDLARELALGDRVIFAAGTSPARLPYLAFDLYVLPSRKEGLPYTLLEAGACGLYPVATDVGGVSELVVDGATGRLVPPDDPPALAAALAAALGLPAQARRAAGEALAARVREKYTRDRMIRDIMDFYGEVLDARGRRQR